MNPEQRDAAARLLEWLAPVDSPEGPCEAVIGFGHFDLRIAAEAARIFLNEGAPWLIFTGGIGAGTADLGQPEADAFREHVVREFPAVPRERIITENRSTNTGDNIRFTLELLAQRRPRLALTRVVLVANPSRQRRVMQTWRQLVPGSTARAAPPATTLEEELRLFREHGQNLASQLVGEVERLQTYPGRGWIAPVDVPAEVLAAATVCRGLAGV